MNCRQLSHAGPRLLTVLAGWLLAGLPLAGCSRRPAEAPAATNSAEQAAATAVKEFTAGKALRAVWLEETAKEGDPMARQLFGFDTSDPPGLRRLGTESGDLARPLVSPDGKGVIFTRLGISRSADGFTFAPQMLWQSWEGGAARPLGAGMAVDVWKNPADGASFIYAVETLQPAAQLRLTGEKLVRLRVDKPEDREIIWTATPLNAEQFQLSRDGRRAAGAFPFPKAGLANLEDQTFTPLAPGAWAGLASDDSYATAVLDGSRKRLRCFAPNLDPGWELTLAGTDGWGEGGILYPRWSTDPLVLTFTGPSAGDTPGADVCLLRLREDLRRVEKILTLTSGRKALTPAVWIEGGGARPSSLPQEPVVVPKPVLKPWPSSEDGLVFAWESAKPDRDKPLPMAPSAMTPRGFATVGRHFEMNLSGGWYEADEAAATRIAQACAASNAWSMELILTERSTQPPVSLRLAALIRADGREEFALYRVDRKLVLRVLLGGTPERPEVVYPVVLTNLAIEGDRPVQVLLTLRNNRLSCWVDGQMMKDFELESSGLAAWGPGKLSFGDPQPYGTPWTGWMERVAIYSRALGEEDCRESAATADQWTTGRTRPTRSKVQARLMESPPASASAAPSPVAPAAAAGTAPAPVPDPAVKPGQTGKGGDELSLGVWEVEQVFMGQVEEKRIAVAQWDKLQGRPVPALEADAAKSAELWLETWDDHPELHPVPLRASPGAEGLPRYFLARPLSPPKAAANP